MRVAAIAGALAATSFVLAVLVLSAPAMATDSCPNVSLRSGYSAYLPDCRAYEMVSPVGKGGADATNPSDIPADAVAVDGGSIAYHTMETYGGQQGSSAINEYLSTRTSSGWSDRGITPAFTNPGSILQSFPFSAWSADLSHMLLEQTGKSVPDNVYLREPDGSLVLLNPGMPPSPFASGNPTLTRGASSDFSHVIFFAEAPLTSSAPPGGGLYEWNDGQLSFLSVLPGGTAVTGDAASDPFGFGLTDGAPNDISSDGSKVFWAFNGSLYVAQNGASTEATTSRCTTGNTGLAGPGGNCLAAGSSGSGLFFTAAADGSVAFFTSSEELTNDANTGSGGGGNDLYGYDVASGALTDLTPDSNPADTSGAGVQGVVGASADGSFVYFVATGTMAAGAAPGEDNLYVWHDGTIRFVAALDGADSSDWNLGHGTQSAQVSGDGAHLVFTSVASLTGYDNAGHSEIYLYDAGSGGLTCVSCNPSSLPAAGDARLAPPSNGGIPGSLPLHVNSSPGGDRVFFETPDALVSRDSNGLYDVYQWETEGTGGCQSTTGNGGCVDLISSGQSSSNSYFAGSSRSGADVFFLTRSRLVGQDADESADVYDARVDGGLASQNPSPASAPCQGDQCQGTPSTPPSAPSAASVEFSGQGNVSPAAKVRVLTRVVHGGTFFVRVRVPGGGRVTITGRGIAAVSRVVRRAGAYRLKVRLTASERSRLRLKRKLGLGLRVRYAPPGGNASTVTVRLTVEQATGPGRRSGRATS